MPVLKIKQPLRPTLRDASELGLPERITPEISLDFQRVMNAIAPETLAKVKVGNSTWAVVAAIASYSDAHVMLMKCDGIYCPGPESLSHEEGDEVFRIAGLCAKFLSRRSGGAQINIGINWGPYGWGPGKEEQGGFQSMPTIIHVHVWVSPAPPEPGELAVFNFSRTEWVQEEDLSPHYYRLLVKNDYGSLMGNLFAAASRKALVQNGPAGYALIRALVNPATWSFDARGACARLDYPLLALTREPRLFSRVVQPIAKTAADLLIRLTEAFTDMNCSQLDAILKKVEYGPLSAGELASLRAVPNVRPEAEIRSRLTTQGLPLDLIPVLLPAIQARCFPSSGTDTSDMWRKGFGYALILSGAVDGSDCELRIMPGVYLGPGGVVEAQRIVLSRVPVPAPRNELLRRSRMLFELGRCVAA